jgi:hypothetical protein
MSEKVRKKRETGSNLLIIFVTSGIGGILNAIANLKHFDLGLVDIGIWIVLLISMILIIIGVVLRQYFYWQADKIWKDLAT